MEFVGRTVKKVFQGFGVFTGTVQSYDESSKFFEIVYEDGDSEELEFSEVVSLLESDGGKVGEAGLLQGRPRVGRKPKKRRRIERLKRGESGKGDETLDKAYENVDLNDGFVDLNVGLVERFRDSEFGNGKLNLNGDSKAGFGETLKEGCEFVNGNLIVDVEIKEGRGLDLNAGFNFKLNEGLNLNLNEENLEGNSGFWRKERECIDLNLDANGEMEEDLEVVETRKKDCGFDLNLGVDDEVRDEGGGDFVWNVEESKSSLLHSIEESVENGELKEVQVTQDFCLEGLMGGIKKEDGTLVEDFKARDGSNGVQLKDESTPPADAVVDSSQGDFGSSYKQASGRRKRRKLDNSNSLTETVLRRSTRRGSARNNVSTSTTSCAFNDFSSSTAAGLSVEEELPDTVAAKRFQEPVVLPPKLQLPPSSQNLGLDGILVVDIFSIYACLRSFSTLLFLSPFKLEDFVAALKSNSPSLLFDSIHVAVLRILRKHLENLSNEGFESATDCLRSLNWNLMDLITWPVFMVEYFLIHSSGLKPGFDLARLKLFKSDYYKQPVRVKVEMLKCLCDDMIEVEAIRLELSRRSSVAEPDMDFDRNINESGKKRRVAVDISGGSCFTEDVVEDANDWNSDECCLCKMDGNLLCCDGCPAAYHSKCIGVTSDLLPEGDWFCPECALDRNKPWLKPRKSLRGAELLGVDPHGRTYISSCGYLLVSDSCDTECTFNYYNKNDLYAVIDVLKSLDNFCGGIINAIYKQWDIPVGLYESHSNFESSDNVHSSMHMNIEAPAISIPLESTKTNAVMTESINERKPEGNPAAVYSGHLDSEVFKSVSALDSVTVMEMPNVSSEGSAETTQISSVIQNLHKQGSDYCIKAFGLSNQFDIPGKSPPVGDSSMTSTGSDIKQTFASPGCMTSVIKARKGDASQVQCESAYMNRYRFAQTASSVAEELLHKSSNEGKEESVKSEEEIISAQMKTILKKSDKFCWPDVQNLNVDTLKEKCGWCFPCRFPTDEMGCLFNMNKGHVWGGLKSEVLGIQSKRNKKGHLIDVICHILSIEDRLHGLLVGPWLNPHYSKLWRKNALKAADLVSVKRLLLALESNLHHLAISAEWSKHVDSLVTLGSASHIVIASSRTSSKHGIGRKRSRCSDFEGNPSSNGAGGLSLCWWRGGRVSCQLFNWKVLPCSLVSKAARQAGCIKVPGILYPESSDFAKRSRNVAWRAAVESSTSVEQLAIQVREFDSNIRWDDIENTHPLCAMDKEFRKSIRLFKKSIIRRKCLKEDGVNYLIDFGKRRNVPDIVLKQGSMVEESSSGRKKYWLKESYVPLHLLKGFEEKRIARKSTKLNSAKLSEASRVTKKSLRRRGFSYLFSKAERSEYYQCGHCNKDVLIREAVCCQYCKGFFHKRHIKKSAGAFMTDCVYTCYQCQDGRFKKTGRQAAKIDTKKGKVNTRSAKVQSQNNKKLTTKSKLVQLKNSKKSAVGRRPVRTQNDKKVAAVPLRRSTRKIKFVSMQNKKHRGRKKGKQKSKKNTAKKPTKAISLQKKRTQTYYCYWLNGLRLSRKPEDERVMQFRRKKFVAAFEHLADILEQPKCYLCCEVEKKSSANYIACEICGEWYHGNAYGLNAEKSNKLIGFRCHVCLKRTPPVCPFRVPVAGHDGSQKVELQNTSIESADVCDPVLPLSELKLKQAHSNDDLQGSLPVDVCFEKEEVLDSSMLESRLEAEKVLALPSEEKNADLIHISNADFMSGVLTSNVNGMLEDNTVEVVCDVTVTLHDQAEGPSRQVDVDLMDAELALLQHDEEKDNLLKSTATLKPSVNGVLEENTVEVASDVTVTLHEQAEVPSCKVDVDLVHTEPASLPRDEEKDSLVKTTATQKPPVNGVLEQNTVRMVSDITDTLHDQAEVPSCKVDVDLMDAESASLQRDEERDNLVKTTATLKPPVDGTLMDSTGLHSQTRDIR